MSRNLVLESLRQLAPSLPRAVRVALSRRVRMAKDWRTDPSGDLPRHLTQGGYGYHIHPYWGIHGPGHEFGKILIRMVRALPDTHPVYQHARSILQGDFHRAVDFVDAYHDHLDELMANEDKWRWAEDGVDWHLPPYIHDLYKDHPPPEQKRNLMRTTSTNGVKRLRKRPHAYYDAPSNSQVHPSIRGTKLERLLRHLVGTHTPTDPIHQLARASLTHTPESLPLLHDHLKKAGHPAAKAGLDRLAGKIGSDKPEKMARKKRYSASDIMDLREPALMGLGLRLPQDKDWVPSLVWADALQEENHPFAHVIRAAYKQSGISGHHINNWQHLYRGGGVYDEPLGVDPVTGLKVRIGTAAHGYRPRTDYPANQRTSWAPLETISHTPTTVLPWIVLSAPFEPPPNHEELGEDMQYVPSVYRKLNTLGHPITDNQLEDRSFEAIIHPDLAEEVIRHMAKVTGEDESHMRDRISRFYDETLHRVPGKKSVWSKRI